MNRFASNFHKTIKYRETVGLIDYRFKIVGTIDYDVNNRC